MAWFDSGRTGSVIYEFTVHAHHAIGAYYPPGPVCKSGGRVGGPNFEAEIIAQNAQWPDGSVSRFVVSVRLFNFTQGPYGKTWSFFSTPVPYPPPGTFDATASATVRITFPVRERKEVRIPAAPGGPYDWLPPDVELAYALHPNLEGDIEIEVTSGDTHFNGSDTYPASNFAADNNHAPYMALSLMSDTSVGGPM